MIRALASTLGDVPIAVDATPVTRRELLRMYRHSIQLSGITRRFHSVQQSLGNTSNTEWASEVLDQQRTARHQITMAIVWSLFHRIKNDQESVQMATLVPQCERLLDSLTTMDRLNEATITTLEGRTKDGP